MCAQALICRKARLPRGWGGGLHEDSRDITTGPTDCRAGPEWLLVERSKGLARLRISGKIDSTWCWGSSQPGNRVSEGSSPHSRLKTFGPPSHHQGSVCNGKPEARLSKCLAVTPVDTQTDSARWRISDWASIDRTVWSDWGEAREEWGHQTSRNSVGPHIWKCPPRGHLCEKVRGAWYWSSVSYQTHSFRSYDRMKGITTFLSSMRKTDVNAAGAWEKPQPNESQGRLKPLKTAVRRRDRAQ